MEHDDQSTEVQALREQLKAERRSKEDAWAWLTFLLIFFAAGGSFAAPAIGVPALVLLIAGWVLAQVFPEAIGPLFVGLLKLVWWCVKLPFVVLAWPIRVVERVFAPPPPKPEAKPETTASYAIGSALASVFGKGR